MKTFKGYVNNKSRPEGCIAERYIQDETIAYCREYKGKGKANLLKKLEIKFEGSTPLPLKSIEYIDDNLGGDECGPVGSSQSVIMESIEYEQARNWVLKSHPNYEYWLRYVVN